jgi:mono/diheme cytochrome c family protein
LSTDRRGLAARCGRGLLPVAVAIAAPLLGGCRQDMHDQPRYDPLEASTFFADGMASRLPPAGTVPRGHLQEDGELFTGKGVDDAFVADLPVTVDRDLLVRGRQRYDIYCAACHGSLGDGQGMVARRGFKQPPSLHLDRIREQPVGYYFDVMTRGFGVMPAYNASIDAADRWAIAAYVRVLQQAQRSHLAELPEQDREALAELAAQGAPGAGWAPGGPADDGLTAPAPGEMPLPPEEPQPGHAVPDAPLGVPAGTPPGPPQPSPEPPNAP